jgi:hypothetical protein
MRSEHKYRQRDHRARRNKGKRAPTHLPKYGHPGRNSTLQQPQAVGMAGVVIDGLALWLTNLGPAYGARFREFFMTEQY